ncbi:MAG TPA: hypothetical protein VKB00_09830, partial [Candidatus Limnocylindrales bacterium]|nr:hypothetical protein [Candidatus Limnocylindrales bacterium]
DPLAGPVVATALLAIPRVIGSIGAWSGRRTVLVAAGVLCLLQSAVAFSLVTLVFLLPAVAFLRAATSEAPAGPRPKLDPVRVVIAVLLGVPVAIAVTMTLGVIGILLLALFAGLAASRRPGRPPVRLLRADAIRGAAIVCLVVGAWMTSFALTETTCWSGRQEADGSITWRRIAVTNELSVGSDEFVQTCSSGTLTSTGAAIGAGLLALSLVAAALPAGRESAFDSG